MSGTNGKMIIRKQKAKQNQQMVVVEFDGNSSEWDTDIAWRLEPSDNWRILFSFIFAGLFVFRYFNVYLIIVRQ